MLFGFIAKRTVILAVVLAIAAMFFERMGVLVSVGVLLGSFLSLYRMRLFGLFLNGVFREYRGKLGKRQIIYQIFSQLSLFAILAVTAIADTRLFMGTAAGLLTLTAVICANAFSEKIGLTRNLWGEAERKGAAAWKK